ncbi:MAG: murein transglycosylase A [Alphaproteobacteria bacterium]|nr:murein transglycosylase A [Alphaproteobacteria bacterium]
MLLFLLGACDQGEDEAKAPPPPAPAPAEEVVPQKIEMVLVPAAFADLPGWDEDDLRTFVTAFSRSCVRILKADPARAFGGLAEAGTYARWQGACGAFLSMDDKSPAALKGFLEAYFQPFAVQANEEPVGLFTGYYEASLRGAVQKGGVYVYPLYKRPEDLVMVNLGAFREALKGQRIAGRVEGGNLVPYASREDIVGGQWAFAKNDDQVLVWVDDPVDAFFVQIQGSGVVQMEDGQTMRIGYAGQNGHPYYAIGRELVARGEMPKEEVSMQSIRGWLEAHPAQADEIMNTNKSYVFFKETEGEGPLGGEGVALTAGRSLAVDQSLMPYGVPLWVDIEAPAGADKNIRRLMMAQDTGGAIQGPVRGDVFWGYGAMAEKFAGEMNSKGRYWVLLPKMQDVETEEMQEE